jgi:hypothetical protein
MKKYFIRIVKYITIFISIIIVLLITATLVINFLFKQQAIEFVLRQLGRQVDAKISICEADFTLWKQFPNASVFFNKVHAQSSNRFKTANNISDKTDTLLVADKIYLEFNLIKLIKGEYKLKRLTIKNGYLKLLIDGDGNANYDIILKSSQKSEKDFELELNDLLFSNTILDYNNLKSSIKFKGLSNKLSIKGNFKAKTYDLKVQSSFVAYFLNVSGNNYIINKPLEMDFNLLVDNKKFQIKDGYFKLANLQFLATGDFDLGDSPDINLRITGKKLNLARLIDILPDRYRTTFNDYSASGAAKMFLSLKGSMVKPAYPKVEVQFSLDNASVSQKSTGLKLHNMTLEGYYSNASNNNNQNSLFKLNKFFANLGSGVMSGTCIIENLSQPLVKITLYTNLNLNELKSFFKIETLDIFSGTVDGNVSFSCKLNTLNKVKTSDIKNFICTGSLKLTNTNVRKKNSDYYFEQINGSITLNNNIYFHDITMFVHGNDYKINGTLTDGIQYFLKQRKDFTLQAEINCNNLDLSKYFVKNTEKTGRKYSRQLLFPEDLNLDVKININKFKLNKFNAKSVSGYVIYKPTMFVLKSVSLDALSGNISGNGAVLQDMYKNFIIKGQVDAFKIDIQQMFYTFNNFSQVVIEDRHLRGILLGKINFSTEWNNALEANLDKVLIDADFTINNCQLVNYEPLQGLSDYISLEELKNIKFSTLKNRIYVKDRQVIIPFMDVASSAFNISASGVHYFDNHYKYKVRVLLSDVLWGKAKKAKRENEEYGTPEDDGLGRTSIYLSINGYKKDFKISYDTKKTMDVLKEGLDKQKSELKTIFKEEFGWYKKDSIPVNNPQTKKKDGIKVEWEKDSIPPQQVPQEEKQPLKKKVKKKDTEPSDEKIKIEWEGN